MRPVRGFENFDLFFVHPHSVGATEQRVEHPQRIENFDVPLAIFLPDQFEFTLSFGHMGMHTDTIAARQCVNCLNRVWQRG